MAKYLGHRRAGYIGSHACKRWLLQAIRPSLFDNLVNRLRDAVKFPPLCTG